jgi:hypothetical protein
MFAPGTATYFANEIATRCIYFHWFPCKDFNLETAKGFILTSRAD